jgi:hypothetical protein
VKLQLTVERLRNPSGELDPDYIRWHAPSISSETSNAIR